MRQSVEQLSEQKREHAIVAKRNSNESGNKRKKKTSR